MKDLVEEMKGLVALAEELDPGGGTYILRQEPEEYVIVREEVLWRISTKADAIMGMRGIVWRRASIAEAKLDTLVERAHEANVELTVAQRRGLTKERLREIQTMCNKRKGE